MKNFEKAIRGILAVLLAGVGVAMGADQPNVVLIYGDDIGYGDVGAYGSEMIPTPNIDRLAKEGLIFTDGHCQASTCTPSRFSLMTGIYAFRHGIGILPPGAPLTVPTDVLTLPKVFKKAGYRTSIIGKWHLGLGAENSPADWNGEVKPGPLEVGFDECFLLPSTNDRVPCVYLRDHRVVKLDPQDPLYISRTATPPEGFRGTIYPDGKTNREAMTYYESSKGHDNSIINGIGRIGYQFGGKAALWDDEGMADEFIVETREFIAAHKDEPFFLFFSSQDIHVPRTPHPRFQGKTELGYRGDAMVQLDWSTGEIMKALEENGLTENTVVIFSSDNGPAYDNGYLDGSEPKKAGLPGDADDRGHFGAGPFRGGKSSIYEGGTRVPFIVRWPARVKPGKSPALVSQTDLLASFAALLEVELAEDEAPDSRNILAALLGEDKVGLPFMVEEARSQIALREGSWKYIHGESLKKMVTGAKRKGEGKSAAGELYNLDEDIAETTNVLTKFPEVAERMGTRVWALINDGRTR
ncbi:MAG: arylsulfatase [Verrucomicrobiota bacterium]